MAVMPTLLIVHHTPSPSMQAMPEAVLSGARDVKHFFDQK